MEYKSRTFSILCLCILILHVVFVSFANSNTQEVTVNTSETCSEDENGEQTCSEHIDQPRNDEKLVPMIYNLGNGDETFHAYVMPDVSSFYQLPDGTKKIMNHRFYGMAGKFINMGPKPLILMWDPGYNAEAIMIAETPPFSSVGTATFPGHQFYFTPDTDGRDIFRYRFDIQDGTSIYVFDPFISNNPQQLKDYGTLENLNQDQYEKYMILKRTIHFSEQYKKVTGRAWLSRFPRQSLKHPLWPADYFGQTHVVETSETHFTSLPPEKDLKSISKYGEPFEKRQLLNSYRGPNQSLNLTLTAVSCAPRAFEIQNFLSDIEIDHVLKLATGLTLSQSTVAGGESGGKKDDATRTSTNSWVYRHHSPIVDSIYRRAADVLRIDEALLRNREKNEFVDYPFVDNVVKDSIGEALQLVHYDVGQQYTAHHDFGYASTTSPFQEARFATILFYLNEGMEGGETWFPRFVNADKNELKVVPEKGKAVLFYNYLPDGNLDDLSQHAAVPVKKGEKWLINLWVWDPIFR